MAKRQQQQPISSQIIKTVSAATAGGSLLLLSGLVLVETDIAVIVATPLLVIFNPILVPAVISMFIIVSGFVASDWFRVAALAVLSWMHKCLTGKHRLGANKIDHARARVATKAIYMKESAQHRIDQVQAS